MIDPKELRIGNLFTWRGEVTQDYQIIYYPPSHAEEIMELTPFIIGNILAYVPGKDFNTIPLNPISLSEEILTEWCGFEISTTRAEIRTDFWKVIREENPYRSIGLDIDGNGLIRCYLLESYDEHTEDNRSDWFHFNDNQIKSLHQLQNLFFALTGTELEIKIPTL